MLGFTVWLTGLPAAGKTTIGDLVAADLVRRGLLVERLDGDVVRRFLSPDLGYSKEDRDVNVLRVAWLASRLTRVGAAVVVSVISPYQEARERARTLVEEHGDFVEVHVSASVEECARRDPKGLYKRAFQSEIVGMTGVDDPYEAPVSPHLRLDTEEQDAEASAAEVIALLEEVVLPQEARSHHR